MRNRSIDGRLEIDLSYSRKDPDNPLSIRSTVLMEYAEHLHTDPSLWELTLEYMGACGNDARDQMAEILKRVSIEIDLKREKGNTDVSADEAEAAAWDRWSAKIDKIITVCKDYGLDDAIVSVCKVSIIRHAYW